MHKARKLLALALALMLALSVMGLAGCGSDETEEPDDGDAAEYTLIQDGKIIAGSDTAYPPFEFIEDGEVKGFDVDLLAAIAEKMGIESEFKSYNFDALIVGLQGGTEFDLIASAMTITEERAQQVDFSDPYIDSNQSLTVREDSDVATLAELEGAKIGVQSGTTGEEYTRNNLPEGATVVPFENILQAMQALQADEVQGVVNDLPISADIVLDESRELKIVEELITNEQYGFAFNQDNPGLRDAVNSALAELRADGTYDDIYRKWFGETP
ncbi:MAG: basic amino acid ABC transporter substrate-binding protein [Anaerosomatales bacterium]|nr:basic amino acid ABC transporter substrate-binding protein [Anaerosomatales bacterium]MDT8435016.1 basic amino acid ABC transporter substrate-binding protein [Anaerosomatales bacterium]